MQIAYGPAQFADVTDAERIRYFEANVLSGVPLARHHLGRMLARNHGRIVFIGSDGPTLVLLHGWPQTGRAWRRVLPALARDHTVVVPDLRGTGASERPDGGYAKT